MTDPTDYVAELIRKTAIDESATFRLAIRDRKLMILPLKKTRPSDNLLARLTRCDINNGPTPGLWDQITYQLRINRKEYDL